MKPTLFGSGAGRSAGTGDAADKTARVAGHIAQKNAIQAARFVDTKPRRLNTSNKLANTRYGLLNPPKMIKVAPAKPKKVLPPTKQTPRQTVKKPHYPNHTTKGVIHTKPAKETPAKQVCKIAPRGGHIPSATLTMGPLSLRRHHGCNPE